MQSGGSGEKAFKLPLNGVARAFNPDASTPKYGL
jgi:hypothetical protein